MIPAELRRLAGIEVGDTVILRAEQGHVVILTQDAILAEIRELFKDVPREPSVVDELIRERREEARRDLEEEEEYLRRAQQREKEKAG